MHVVNYFVVLEHLTHKYYVLFRLKVDYKFGNIDIYYIFKEFKVCTLLP